MDMIRILHIASFSPKKLQREYSKILGKLNKLDKKIKNKTVADMEMAERRFHILCEELDTVKDFFISSAKSGI